MLQFQVSDGGGDKGVFACGQPFHDKVAVQVGRGTFYRAIAIFDNHVDEGQGLLGLNVDNGACDADTKAGNQLLVVVGYFGQGKAYAGLADGGIER